MRSVLKWTGIALGAMVLVLALVFGYWLLRPNQASISDLLAIETWDVVNNGAHNSNTDMIYWNDAFYLVHASSPFHFASVDSRLSLLRSEDARNWEEVARFDAAGEDIRDPKFAAVQDHLFLYALKNTDFTAEPYQTVYAVSDDGLSWSPFEEMIST